MNGTLQSHPDIGKCTPCIQICFLINLKVILSDYIQKFGGFYGGAF
ncbi:MAG: hypothetical protein IPH98_11175 [Saprospiraceae bacterium]|nr:hypothetical protein [Candidatus Defluviibacterium haderslevense]